jgi:ZIP family zinc transporter
MGGVSGTAFAVGALLDGVPESFVIGVSMLGGGAVSLATVVAIFVSNLPEGLASSVAMRRAGRRPAAVFGLWVAIALAGAVSAGLGLAVAELVGPALLAMATGLAAGAVLAMVADTMIPESYEVDRAATGLWTVLGFLAAFALSKAA